MKIEPLIFILIVFPFLAAVCCYLIRSKKVRSIIIMATACLLVSSAVLLIPYVPFSLSPETFFGISVHNIISISDFLLLIIILYYGFKHHSLVIKGLAFFQIIFTGYMEFFLIQGKNASSSIYCDHVSLIMVLIISIVGSIISIQAIPYMKNHEEHQGLKKSGQHRFFFVLILFLGAMNGLVLSNDMMVFYFFFEVTTLCSFLLIGHDQTEIATKNAVRALWMNSLGGAAFIVAVVLIYQAMNTMDMQQIIHAVPKTGILILPLALLCVAAFTKSAQFPFQSWLLGAMVAPTPVSALLHSSTMVKVGVYLALRFAPAMQGMFLSQCVALFGGFTFLAAAALAVGQSNGKKVLAYSTISNLGLIFACVGINTPESLTAAIIFIIFHAVTKALLFLCVGTIEQHIESRDIEDMRGLYAKMPVTALISVMGVIMMIMPPFGVVLSKWMAMEAAAGNLLVTLMVAFGSALTVMYWARWAGTLMSDPFAGRFTPERQPLLTWCALLSLCAGGGILSIAAPWLYTRMIVPGLKGICIPTYAVHNGVLENSFGEFAVLPLGLIAFLGFIVSIWAVKRAAKARIVTPYVSGLQTSQPGVFRGPMNRPVKAEAKNYYLSSIFGEEKLTPWINLGAGVLLTLLVGGAL